MLANPEAGPILTTDPEGRFRADRLTNGHSTTGITGTAIAAGTAVVLEITRADGRELEATAAPSRDGLEVTIAVTAPRNDAAYVVMPRARRK